MDLKILMAIVTYYSLVSLIFVFGQPYLSDSHINNPPNINQTIDVDSYGNFSSDPENSGFFDVAGTVFQSIWNNIKGIGRFIAFVGFGVGLPSSTPGWAAIILAFIQSGVSILTIGFIINSVWGGGG